MGKHALIADDTCNFDIAVFSRVFKTVLHTAIFALEHAHSRIPVHFRSTGRTGKRKLFPVFIGDKGPPVKQQYQFVKGSPSPFGKQLLIAF